MNRQEWEGVSQAGAGGADQGRGWRNRPGHERSAPDPRKTRWRRAGAQGHPAAGARDDPAAGAQGDPVGRAHGNVLESRRRSRSRRPRGRSVDRCPRADDDRGPERTHCPDPGGLVSSGSPSELTQNTDDLAAWLVHPLPTALPSRSSPPLPTARRTGSSPTPRSGSEGLRVVEIRRRSRVARWRSGTGR